MPMTLTSSIAEASLRVYGRVTPTERGAYRLARFVRRFRPPERWQDAFRLPSGIRMELDLGVYPDCCMAFGVYETSTLRLIRRLLRPGDHFVDAGANIGYITMHAARLVGPAGRVDAFEPEPRNRARLLRHLEQNGLTPRVTVHPVALADRDGEADIHTYLDHGVYNHGSSSLFADPQARHVTTRIPMTPLDARLGEASPRLVKIDVEGAEPLVIAGMRRLLTRPNPPALIGEINPSQSRHAGFAADEWVRRALAIQPRYRVFTIGQKPRAIDLARLASLGQVNVYLEAPAAS